MKQLQGGSLFYALAISVIVGIMLSSLVGLEYYHRVLLQSDLTSQEVIRNAQSGIVYACGVNPIDQHNDLYGRGSDSVEIVQYQWGVYSVYHSKAHTGTFSHESIALIGEVPVQDEPALWLADMDRPLFLTGNTLIKGTCFLPKAGVERAYIEGKSFSGEKLILGQVKTSARFFPTRDTAAINAITRQFSMEADSIVRWEELSNADVFSRSFSDVPVQLESPGKIVIGNIHMVGRIKIKSSSVIIVERTAVLENVLLFAPRVIINAGTSGFFQAFATDSVIVEEDVQLEFPSAIGIVPGELPFSEPAINFGEESYLGGELFLYYNNKSILQEGNILINQDACVEGTVSCDGTLDLKGKVHGSVKCMKFRLKTNSAVYENHLMDAVIDVSQRNDAWLSGISNVATRKKSIVSWLK